LSVSLSRFSSSCLCFQVLFVPDQDELDKVRPKPTDGATPTDSATPTSNQPKSAPPSVSHAPPLPEAQVGSGETGHSASVSSPATATSDNGVLATLRGGAREDKEGVAERKAEFQVFSPSSSPPSLVDCARDFVEEVTDTHVMVVSKYISEDQVSKWAQTRGGEGSDSVIVVEEGGQSQNSDQGVEWAGLELRVWSGPHIK